MIASLLTLLLVGFVGLIAISIILAIVGAILSVTFGLVGLLMFKIVPVLFVGWLVLRVIERGRSRRQISAADQRWLDS